MVGCAGLVTVTPKRRGWSGVCAVFVVHFYVPVCHWQCVRDCLLCVVFGAFVVLVDVYLGVGGGGASVLQLCCEPRCGCMKQQNTLVVVMCTARN